MAVGKKKKKKETWGHEEGKNANLEVKKQKKITVK